MIRILVSLCLSLHAFGEIAGDPISIQPKTNPNGWIDYSNDNNIPDQTDNNFTAGFEGGLRIHKILMGASYNLLTNITKHDTKGKINYTGIRTDQLSLVVGEMLVEQHHWSISVDVGMRTTGQYGGSKVQNGWHELIGSKQYDCINYDKYYVSPLVITHSTYQATLSSNVSVEPTLTTGATYNGLDVNVSLPIVISDSDKNYFWFGPLWDHHFGGSLGATDEYVNGKYNQMNGIYLSAGIHAGYINLSVLWNKNVGYGSIGVMW